MKKFLMATAATALMTGTAFADAHAKEVKIGVILGFTGPLESITPAMGAGAELAMAEVTDSGALLDGAKVVSIRGDSTCIDAGAATSAAERLITSDKVSAIMGADCSGRDRCDTAKRGTSQRHRHDLAVGHIAPACRLPKMTACSSAPLRRTRVRV